MPEHTKEERLPLWSLLRELASSTLINQSPWLVVGDFNQILSLSEAYSLLPTTISLPGIVDLHDCLSDCGLFDLFSRGCHHTWTNKAITNPKTRKLDRAVINESWQDVFPNSYALFDAPGSSDNSPCLVSLANDSHHRKSRFNFFSFFTLHPEYRSRITEAWQSIEVAGCSMFVLYQRLRAAKLCCKDLNRSSFSNIQAPSREAFDNLENIQREVLSCPTPELFEEESEARKAWLLFSAAEEIFFKQKSRVRWLKEGNSNSHFFYKSVKANLSKNIVHHLRDNNGTKVSQSTAIKNLVVNYFILLLGTSSTHNRSD
ncbi:unnamed protein product [Microthlaspi erraticum]|uniref:Endonuclease/exonuclease/phosphatase domain-containing protein n=1 Tax=Microthlaspi erraticum TaxID=1685480 RepID=A0A6D2ILV5_9BRAS|nr:unnamed protein product [Microthlaspi erraticum]